MLVHVQAYGAAAKVPALVARHSQRIRKQISAREHDEVERLEAEYAEWAERLVKLNPQIADTQAKLAKLIIKSEQTKTKKALGMLQAQRDRAAAKIGERDEKIAEACRRAEEDRRDVDQVGAELVALYGDPDELLKHARVVEIAEIAENEYNLNIPRYVDTFEPERRVEVKDALSGLRAAEAALADADQELSKLLKAVGYAE
jgi:type I restriction enzyme M protein